MYKSLSTTLCAAVALVPVDGAALALETKARGAGLSLMICLLLTLPNHIAVSLTQSLNCSHRRQKVAETPIFTPRGRVLPSPSLLFSLSVLVCHLPTSQSFPLTSNILSKFDASLQRGGQVKD